ncbi:hypothetical protein MRX96_026790 [Rhipicephalus microplus]
MPRCCCVPLCKSNAKNTPHVGFHEFPVDAKRREAWLRNISRNGHGGRGPNWTPRDTSLVCSQHFRQQDYKTNAKIRLLLPNAVPTVFPPQPGKKAVPTARKRFTVNKNGTFQASGSSKRAAAQQAVQNGDGSVKDESSQTPSGSDANETTRRLRAKVAHLQEVTRRLQCKLDEAEERAEFYENNKDIDLFMKVIDAAALGDETAEFIVNEVYSFHEDTKLI